MKSNISTIAFALLLSASASAKTNQDLLKAEYLYSHLAFHEAIEFYQKAVPQVNDPVMLSRLGDCYRLTKEPAKAAEWYAKAVAISGCPDDAKLHYAQVLMTLEKYDDALTYAKQYAAAKPGDRRAKNMILSCESASEMKSAMPKGNVSMLALNTDHSEFGPAIRRNELFFTADTGINVSVKQDAWTGNSFYTIYSANCDANGNCNMDIRPLKGNINTKYHDGPCSFSKDGTVMYFTRTFYTKKFLTRGPIADNNDMVHLEIMIASDYDEAAGEYKTIKPFKYNDKRYSVAHPALSADGNTLVFSSDMPGGEGGTDLYMSKKEKNGDWQQPVNLGKAINTEGDEMLPFMDKSNTLFFASNGLQGYGGLDIYAASAAAKGYADPQNMGMPLNSSYDDMSLVYNDAGNISYFASDRPAAKGGDNIYTFNSLNIAVSIKVVDASTGKLIPDANVLLTGNNETKVFKQGEVLTSLYPQSSYSIKAEAFGYGAAEDNVSTLNVTHSDTLSKVIKLKPEFNIRYNALVLDEDTRLPIEDPTVIFMKTGDLKPDTARLSTGTAFSTSLDVNNTYHVYAIKDNYYSNEKIVSTNGMQRTFAGTTVRDTLYMKALKVGGVYNIDNIYYDYNKTNIREDARPSLNRLLDLLNQYPQMSIQINSHTDCRGSDSYNLKLSNGRATSVIKYLQQRGITGSRLKSRGYGESMPVEKCSVCEQCTEEEHQKNRRTEFQIISM